MSKQIMVVGFATEGPTDIRFLESIVQRSFEDVAFECRGQIEVLPIQVLKKHSGNFVCVVGEYAREAQQKGIMVLCIHVDADDVNDFGVFSSKINPAFASTQKIPNGTVCKNLVAVVPVQMTEAWMLCDKALLKAEIGTSKTDEELGIGKSPENYSNPKQVIETAIAVARRNLTRRRRRRLTISDLYAPMGQKISLDSLKNLPSYLKFRQAIGTAFRQLNFLF